MHGCIGWLNLNDGMFQCTLELAIEEGHVTLFRRMEQFYGVHRLVVEICMRASYDDQTRTA
jgi:hypothetical protein